MHPGQYCVLGSDKPQVVENSLAEFEYHADMIRMMGYGRRLQAFKCNLHIAGRLGADGVRAVWPRLPSEARHCLALEHDDKSYGRDGCLSPADPPPRGREIPHRWLHQGGAIAPDNPHP